MIPTLQKMTDSKKVVFHILAFVVGIVVGFFIVFQILFLSKVLPHGGF